MVFLVLRRDKWSTRFRDVCSRPHSSVQPKVPSQHPGKPMCAPPCLSEVSPMLGGACPRFLGFQTFSLASIPMPDTAAYRNIKYPSYSGGAQGYRRFPLSKPVVGQIMALHAVPADKATSGLVSASFGFIPLHFPPKLLQSSTVGCVMKSDEDNDYVCAGNGFVFTHVMRKLFLVRFTTMFLPTHPYEQSLCAAYCVLTEFSVSASCVLRFIELLAWRLSRGEGIWRTGNF